MSDDRPTEPLPEQPGPAAAEAPAGADPANPDPSGYAQPAYATQAYAPAASPTSSRRTLWIALGVGGAAAVVFVLLGGLAFGVVMRHGFDRGDRTGWSSADQRGNGYGDRGPGGMMGDPGNGWGSQGNGSPQGSLGGQWGGPMGNALGGPLAGALRDGLHGEMVVPDGSGSYTTVAMQRGSVTAVNSSSLTVKSSDGFAATYRVDGTTNVMGSMMGGASVTDLSTGDNVVVMAQGSDAPLTVRWVAPTP